MSELGSGSGSSYPSALDTNTTLEVNSPSGSKTKARAEVPNDSMAAIVAVQTELGTDPAGSLADVKTYLQTEHNTDGTHSAVTATSVSTDTITEKTATVGVTIDGAVIKDGVMLVHAPTVVVLTDAATIATDCSLGSTFTVTLAGNRTLGAPTNPTDGQRCIWRFKQDVTGTRTITLNAVFRLGTDISAVTLTTTASKTDYIGAIYNSADTKWDIVAFIKGY